MPYRKMFIHDFILIFTGTPRADSIINPIYRGGHWGSRKGIIPQSDTARNLVAEPAFSSVWFRVFNMNNMAF